MDNSMRSVSAIVDYDYSANEPDELDLVKGAIIHNIKIQPGGWWEGTLASNGRTGMFPDNFVHIIDPDEKSPVVLRDKSATVHRRCKVIYSYTQQNEDELSLAVGNIIEVLGEVEEGWWRGKIGDRVGVFPSNFVETVPASPILANKRPNSTKKETNRSLHSSREDLLSTSPSSSPSSNLIDKDAPVLPPKPVREYCRVLYPYDPQNEDELELQVSEIITVISKELPDKGWWRGEIRGKVGVFPDNFVKLLPPEVSPSKDPHHLPDKPPTGPTNLSYTKKLSSQSSTQGSTRKDSFGSRDSLNDILNETGIVSGNVAAQRKSLETKNLDLTSGAGSVDGKLRKSLETKPTEMRKSLDNPDDKKTPPPVLTKKPTVPAKSKNSVTSVAGSLLSGFKQKVKSVEHKVTSHDSMDGMGSSKPASQIADNGERGVVGEKLRKSDVDFDQVERDTLLSDMRATRAKAPRRRPPSAAINAIGESNNNDSTYLNGSSTYTEVMSSESRADSLEGEKLVAPKPRDWGKVKAPWMEELKANQAKKTYPVIEPRAVERTRPEPEVASRTITEKSDMSRSTANSYSSTSSSSSQRKTLENTSASVLSSSMASSAYEVKTTAMESNLKRELNDTARTVSSSLTTSGNAAITTPVTAAISDDSKSRPTSLSILSRSISPIAGRTITSTTTERTGGKAMTTTTATILSSTTTALDTAKPNSIVPVNDENVCTRVMELEERIHKLENTVHAQTKIIDELVRCLKEETDKVKGLKTELDKYAQCVTQV